MRRSQTLSRRRLLAQTAGLTMASVIPSHVLGGRGQIPPSEQLRVAVIGTGGQGITNIKTLPRSQGHHRDWINACKGGPPASSNFDYAAHLTELVLLGTVALRTGETIRWDGPNMRAINSPKAEPLIHGHFRPGWEI